jgi:hypothetical protein
MSATDNSLLEAKNREWWSNQSLEFRESLRCLVSKARYDLIVIDPWAAIKADGTAITIWKYEPN